MAQKILPLLEHWDSADLEDWAVEVYGLGDVVEGVHCWVLCFTSYMLFTVFLHSFVFTGGTWLVEAEMPHNSQEQSILSEAVVKVVVTGIISEARERIATKLPLETLKRIQKKGNVYMY